MLTNPSSLKIIDIYLIRHGATWINSGIPERDITPNEYIQGGNADQDLNKLSLIGKKEAYNVGMFLKEQFPHLPLIYTACLKRTVETAKIAAKVYGFPIKGLDDSDDKIAINEDNIIKIEDLAEIRHGRNDGVTKVAFRNALYKKMFDQEKEKHPFDAIDFDPYWKWKLVPNENGAVGSFDDSESAWQLLIRTINALTEIANQHLEKKDLGKNIVAITSSAVILTLITNSFLRKYLKECKKSGADPIAKELPIFFEQTLAKSGGIYHFRFHKEEKELLNKIEFIEEVLL